MQKYNVIRKIFIFSIYFNIQNNCQDFNSLNNDSIYWNYCIKSQWNIIFT